MRSTRASRVRLDPAASVYAGMDLPLGPHCSRRRATGADCWPPACATPQHVGRACSATLDRRPGDVVRRAPGPCQHTADIRKIWTNGSRPAMASCANSRTPGLRGGGRDVVLDTTALVHEIVPPPLATRRRRLPGSIAVSRVREQGHAIGDRRPGAPAWQRAPWRRPRARHADDRPARWRGGWPRNRSCASMKRSRTCNASTRAWRRWWKCASSPALNDLEIAAVLGVTDRTVRRDWQQAQLFLAEALR